MKKLQVLLVSVLGLASLLIPCKDDLGYSKTETRVCAQQEVDRFYTRQDLVDACSIVEKDTLAGTEPIVMYKEGDYVIIESASGRKTRMLYFPESGHGFRTASQPENKDTIRLPELPRIKLPDPPKEQDRFKNIDPKSYCSR